MKILPLIVLFIVLASPLMAQHQFSWLTGTWKLKDKFVYEEWRASDDKNILLGKSYRIKASDTVITENIRITYHDGAFHYLPDVPENKSVVDFKITKYDNRSFVAENPLHDFPKIIRYTIVRKENAEFLEAAIEGNGKVIAYTFQKVR